VFFEMWKISKSVCRELDVALRLSRSRLKHSQRKQKWSKCAQLLFEWFSINHTHWDQSSSPHCTLSLMIFWTMKYITEACEIPAKDCSPERMTLIKSESQLNPTSSADINDRVRCSRVTHSPQHTEGMKVYEIVHNNYGISFGNFEAMCQMSLKAAPMNSFDTLGAFSRRSNRYPGTGHVCQSPD
jgi:hypothetical protein